ncbi:MAG: hypothetical protein MUE40_10780 [Anaerolineae bacterium]|nr:hypothetical protein [Anaerolineae bacterium]
MNRIVSRQDVLYSGARHTSIYYFELQRDDRTVTMPIISTPFIVRFVASLQLRVIHTADSERADPRITAEEPALQELALA